MLPAGFRLGVATSGFQIEGGYNGPGQPANNWASWERRRGVAAAGPALDFWNRWPEVLDRAAAAGCDTFRLSVEWARCEPAPGDVDDGAFARYGAILQGCRERGLEPVVALLHFTHPAWLGDRFWLDLRSPERFAAWAGTAAGRLGHLCRNWITINEINVLAFQSFLTGRFPPGGRGRAGDAVRALGHLLAGHVLAYEAVHRHRPGAVVSTNNQCQSVYEFGRLLIDVLLSRSHGVPRPDLRDWLAERRRAYHRGVAAPGRVERLMRRAAAAMLPLDRALPRAAGEVYTGRSPRPLDVVQINFYDPVAGHRLGRPGRRTAGGRAWSPLRQIWDDPVDPEGLARYCRLNTEPGLELWIAEHGLCNRVRAGRVVPRLDGWDRVRFLDATARALAGVVAEGVPLTRYYHWTLADNYEWGSYEHRFGLHRVDAGAWSALDAFGGDAASAFRAMAACASTR